MKNKFLLLILILLLVLIFGIIGIKLFGSKDNSVNSNEGKINEEIKEEYIYNSREEVVEDKEVNGIKFTNINCYWDGANSHISYTIVNTTDEVVNIGKYKIEVYDENEVKIYSLSPYLNYDLSPGSQFDDLISTADNLSDAYSIKIFLD